LKAFTNITHQKPKMSQKSGNFCDWDEDMVRQTAAHLARIGQYADDASV
jgi:hypothetical protein